MVDFGSVVSDFTDPDVNATENVADSLVTYSGSDETQPSYVQRAESQLDGSGGSGSGSIVDTVFGGITGGDGDGSSSDADIPTKEKYDVYDQDPGAPLPGTHIVVDDGPDYTFDPGDPADVERWLSGQDGSGSGSGSDPAARVSSWIDSYGSGSVTTEGVLADLVDSDTNATANIVDAFTSRTSGASGADVVEDFADEDVDAFGNVVDSLSDGFTGRDQADSEDGAQSLLDRLTGDLGKQALVAAGAAVVGALALSWTGVGD